MTDWVERYHQQKRTEQDAKGGPGSGHWGHAGRPGKRGGSLPGKGQYHIPELKSNFSTKGKAIEWMRSQGIVTGTSWTSKQARVAADTLVSIKEKIGSLLIGAMEPSKRLPSSYDPKSNIVWVNTEDRNGTPELVTKDILGYIEHELDKLSSSPETPYKQRLKEQRELLNSGDYKKAHTLYWFGEDRIQAIVRHEMGHAFHKRYDMNSVTDASGRFTGIDDLRREALHTGTEWEWRDEYGITARGRDNWNECVAENFVAWSVGQTDLMNPKMVEMFDLIAEQATHLRDIVEGRVG